MLLFFADKPPATIPKTKTNDALLRIFQQNGIKGLFAGVTPRIVKVAPACAIMITSFEYGKLFFYRRNVAAHEQKIGDGHH